jgi:hypothetical protein
LVPAPRENGVATGNSKRTVANFNAGMEFKEQDAAKFKIES